MTESERICDELDRQAARDRGYGPEPERGFSVMATRECPIHADCGMWQVTFRSNRRWTGYLMVGRTGAIEHVPAFFGAWFGKEWFGRLFSDFIHFMQRRHHFFAWERVTTTAEPEGNDSE